MEKTARELKIRAFGIARDIVGGREFTVTSPAITVGELKQQLCSAYPELMHLKAFFIAVDNTYADDNTELTEGAELALIPPVSGG